MSISRRDCCRGVAATVLAVALPGCPTGQDDEPSSFWADPPAFDADRLETVTDRDRPSRPEPLPVGPSSAHVDAWRDRTESLIGSVPSPLTAERLPDGRLRDAITSERATARQAIERATAAETRAERVDAMRVASESAGSAAGIWAAITDDGEPAALSWTRRRVANAVSDATAQLPGSAAGPQEGTVFYGALEGWLYDDADAGIPESRWATWTPDPLPVGQAVGGAERARTRVELAAHLRDRYVASLAEPVELTAQLRTTVDTLADPMRDRLAPFYDDPADMHSEFPDLGARLSEDVFRDQPGYRLLQEKTRWYDRRDRPIASMVQATDYPATALRDTHQVFAVVDASEALLSRLNDGEVFFPPDADALRDARGAAIDAIGEVAAAADPLSRWQAWRLGSLLAGADETVTRSAHGSTEAVARAYTGYIWIESVATSVPDATERVLAALAQ